MKTRKFLSLLLAGILMLVMLPQAAFADTNRIHLSNVSVSFGNASGNAPRIAADEISADGRVFTFNDTKGEDVEHYLAFLHLGSSPILFHFIADVNTLLYNDTGTAGGSGNQSAGLKAQLMELMPYETDPNYVIFNFSLRDAANGGKLTRFTFRIKKWERQYEKEVVAPGWQAGLYCTAYKDGTETVSWTAVSGKPHHWEFLAAKNVTFPYTLQILTGIHSKTKLYMDGKQLFLPGNGKGLVETLTFNSNKTYYDFVIDPGTAMDDKYTTGVKSYWRINVTGKAAQGMQTLTKSQLSYSLSAKTYNGKAQGISVTPKSGAGEVTAVYYTGTSGTSYKKSSKAPKNAGSYAITVDVAAGSTFKTANGLALGTFTIKKANLSEAKLSVDDTAWTGRQIKPTKLTFNGVSLKVSSISSRTTYGANKNIGKGTIKITGKGNFTGTKTVSFKTVPKKNSISKITTGKKQLKVTWKKVSAAQKITNYEVRYRVKGAAKWKTKSYAASVSSATIKSLIKGKTYQIQVRSYKTVSGAMYYSAWSATKISGKIK